MEEDLFSSTPAELVAELHRDLVQVSVVCAVVIVLAALIPWLCYRGNAAAPVTSLQMTLARALRGAALLFALLATWRFVVVLRFYWAAVVEMPEVLLTAKHKAPLLYHSEQCFPIAWVLLWIAVWHLAPIFIRWSVGSVEVWPAAAARWLGLLALALALHDGLALQLNYLGERMGTALFPLKVLEQFTTARLIGITGTAFSPLFQAFFLACLAFTFLWLAPPILRSAVPPETSD